MLAFKRVLIIVVGLFMSGQSVAEEKAIFAGGCFWCMQPAFDEVRGVTQTVVGYTGGTVKNPTYEQVSAGVTGHTEAIEVSFDPMKVSYPELLAIFWHNIDPLVKGRQFCDVGTQYRSGIYYLNAEQQSQAEASIAEIGTRLNHEIHTEIAKATTFYPAEEYHQEYYQKNPVRYKFYRYNCGRDKRLKEIWEKTKD